MKIIQLKKTLSFSLILITFNIQATSSENKSIKQDNLQLNKVSKSCVAVESERDKKRRLQKGKERADLFVQMDSFTSYFTGFEKKMDDVAPKDTMLYLYASMGISAVGFKTVFTPMLLGVCNTEAAINNKCNYKMDRSGGQMVMETKWENATKYTMTQSIIEEGSLIKRKTMIVSTELPNYWNGTMTLFDEDGSKSETSWSRDTDGTEHYHSESVGATEHSSATFTEYPNCSADVTYVKNDVKITANWTLIGEKTSGSFKSCNKKGCQNGSW